MMRCRACDVESDYSDPDFQWWNLRDYFGISGSFCSPCYDKVSHDSYGRPNQPEEFLMMLLKLSGR